MFCNNRIKAQQIKSETKLYPFTTCSLEISTYGYLLNTDWMAISDNASVRCTLYGILSHIKRSLIVANFYDGAETITAVLIICDLLMRLSCYFIILFWYSIRGVHVQLMTYSHAVTHRPISWAAIHSYVFSAMIWMWILIWYDILYYKSRFRLIIVQ